MAAFPQTETPSNRLPPRGVGTASMDSLTNVFARCVFWVVGVKGNRKHRGGFAKWFFLVFQDETGEKDSPSCQQCFQKDPVWILPRDVYEG